MKPRFRHLLQLALVLAMAMARFERRPLLRTAELFRGYALQVVARRVTGQVLTAPGHQAVLVWSQLRGAPGRGLRNRLAAGLRSAAAVAAASGTGLALFLASNALLIIPIRLVMAGLGRSAHVPVVVLTVAVGRLSLTLARALQAYTLERRRQPALLPVGAAPVWRLDLLGASPPGRGYGGALTDLFTARADRAGAVVYLVTDGRNRAFYRRRGFHVIEPSDRRAFRSVLLMRRLPRVASGRVPPQRRRAEVTLDHVGGGGGI